MDSGVITSVLADADIGEISALGWQTNPEMSRERWLVAMRELFAVYDSLKWVIGDGLNFGEVRLGEAYMQIGEETGWSYQHLADVKWVSKSVPFEVRRADLSWSHHRMVAAIKHPEQQAMWLERAARGGWSTLEMVRRMRALDDGDDEELLRLEVVQPARSPVVLASEIALLPSQRIPAWVGNLTTVERERARDIAARMVESASRLLEYLNDDRKHNNGHYR